MVNVRRESGNAGMDLKRPQNRKDRHWTRHLVPVLVCWRWQAQGKAIPCIGWLCRWWKVTIKSQAQIQHGIFTAFVPQAYQNHLLASVERPSKKKKTSLTLIPFLPADLGLIDFSFQMHLNDSTSSELERPLGDWFGYVYLLGLQDNLLSMMLFQCTNTCSEDITWFQLHIFLARDK